jgi:hypothetical protein
MESKGVTMIAKKQWYQLIGKLTQLTVILCIVAGLTAGAAEKREMKIEFEHDGDPVYSVLPPGKIPAIDDPVFISGEAADKQMAPAEPVFGIVMGDVKRAYSLWQLDHHEIVNDSIGGVAFAATW